MLVLSRRESERVRLGDSIILTIVRVSGDKVRLGIEAPPNVLVLRDELQIHSEAPPTANEPTPEPCVPPAKAA
jgi:carbon storage regulator